MTMGTSPTLERIVLNDLTLLSLLFTPRALSITVTIYVFVTYIYRLNLFFPEMTCLKIKNDSRHSYFMGTASMIGV